MTEQPEHDTVRTQTFPVDGPVDLDVEVTLGRVEIELSAEATEATVEVRHDPTVREPWAQGVTSLLTWVNERFGDQIGRDLRGSAADALEQTRIERTGNRIVVHAAKALPLRNIPLGVTVRAPAGTQLSIRAGSADG